MKFFRITAVLFFMMLVSPMAHALDGAGTIEEVMNCGTGQPDPGWKQVLLFKLSDGKWFGIFADHISSAASDYDSDSAVSMVLTAFTARLPVSVSISYQNRTFCEITAAMHWSKAGDYIKIAR